MKDRIGKIFKKGDPVLFIHRKFNVGEVLFLGRIYRVSPKTVKIYTECDKRISYTGISQVDTYQKLHDQVVKISEKDYRDNCKYYEQDLSYWLTIADKDSEIFNI